MIFRLHDLPYGELEGYYTYNQIQEAIGCYAKKDQISPLLNPLNPDFLGHLVDVAAEMRKYSMKIILAREVIVHDNMCDTMVGTLGIHPYPFRSKKNTYAGYKVTAPNYTRAKFCGNCVHFSDTTEQDDMLSGVCEIHTQLDGDYDPPLKTPMELSCYSVCDDFVMKEDYEGYCNG